MRLIVDSNIVFSALISSFGETARLLFSDKLELFAPTRLFLEFEEHKAEIMDKSYLNSEEFELIAILVFSKIALIEDEELFEFEERAAAICPDIDDAPFFAACLNKDLPLWSNDKDLKKQKVVQVLNTDELSKLV